MSGKSNVKRVELSAGELKYNRIIELTITDKGTNADNVNFADFTFEQGVQASHVTVINDGGVNPVWFVFDALGSTISTSENPKKPTTYNGKAYPGSPLNKVGYDGSASSIGFKCATGKSTTVKLLIW